MSENTYNNNYDINNPCENTSYGNNPYGYNPYGNNPYMYNYVPKKSFSQRAKEYFSEKPFNGLSVLAGFGSLAIMMHLMCSFVTGLLIAFSDTLAEFITTEAGTCLLGIISSVFCVGLPFIIVFFIMRRFDSTSFDIPFGRPRKNSHTALIIVAGLGVCYIGNIVSGYVTVFFQSMGIEFFSTETTSAITETDGTPVSFLLSLISVAVFPAIFEEIAFRGILLQSLRKYGDWFAIGVSAVMFGLIHGNMTQLPFALIAGIALGYTFVVTGSVWPAIILHFFNNSLALVYSTAVAGLSEERGVLFSVVSVYGIIIVGMVALTAYGIVNRNFLRLRQGSYPGMSKRRKVGVYFLMPTMFISVLVLLTNILSDLFIGMLR